MAKLSIGAVALNVECLGEKSRPALLLAHPLGANLTLWRDMAPKLAEKFFVVTFDTRGHGGSDAPTGPYRFDDLGADALRLLDALGLETVDFVGVSMGGALGQWLLLNAPQRVRKLALANTGPSFPPPEGWNARIRAARAGDMTSLAATVVRRWLTADFEARHPEEFARIQAMIAATPAQGYAGCCSALRDIDFSDALRCAPPRPTLVLTGDQDLSSPPAQGRKIFRALKQSEILALPGAHLSCVEHPDAFWGAVDQFLGQD